MRRTALLFAAALLMAACQPGDNPNAAPTPASGEVVPEMPMDAPPQEELDTACGEEVGRAAAERLVERCVMVSPATHPPCNVANPCEMIRGEIERACAMYDPGETRPAECAA